MSSFEKYLQNRKYHPRVVKAYLDYLKLFSQWANQQGIDVIKCQYVDLIGYIKEIKKKDRSVYTLNNYIRAIKYYFQYLIQQEIIINNPASNIHIKGRVQQLPQDLLSLKQMEQIYTQYPHNTPAQKRNKIIIGLAIYQALRQDEIAALTPDDIQLHQGYINIKKTGRGARRTLKLQAQQIIPLQEYILQVRDSINQKKQTPAHQLIISSGKNTGIKEIISDLNKALRKQYPKYKNLLHIRTSVISLWINEYNIVKVQYMAGHKSINSTEVYQKVNLNDLKKNLNLFHPLR